MTRWPALPGAKPRKYRNEPVRVDGYAFDSEAEARRWRNLRLLEVAGQIAGLKVHPVYEVFAAFHDSQGRRVRAITWEADFAYAEAGRRVVEDVKSRGRRKGKRWVGGTCTEAWRIKVKLFKARYPDVEVRVVWSTDV